LEKKIASLLDLSSAKEKVLEADLVREQHKEKLRLDFAQIANEYQRWTSDQIEECSNIYFGDSIDAVGAYRADLTKNEGDITSTSESKRKTYQVS
jgi:hypothetical protein